MPTNMEETSNLLVGAGFAIMLVLFGTESAFGFTIHDLDYENSPYDNKKMPIVGQPMRLFYQVVNYSPQSQSNNVTISITNLDEDKQVFHTNHQYKIGSNEFEDLIWNFTPESQGLYFVMAIESSGKIANYVFAVTKDDDFRQKAKANPEVLDDKSPRKQFRMGIDPKEITCKENLYLALKPSSLPVCVRLETLKDMRKREFVIQENIDYDKIGFVTSENQFKKMLSEKNIEYTSENFLFIEGMSLTSLPPISDYCGYVQDNNKGHHWFSTTYHYDVLSNSKISDQTPSPCQPSTMSCFCFLQTNLAEKNPKMSYFTKSEEVSVGKAISKYLNGTKIANVSNQFIVGKYNLESDQAEIHYCGKFTGGGGLRDFEGYIKNGTIVDFSLAAERPKLCAVSNDATTFTFAKSSIEPDSFYGQ